MAASGLGHLEHSRTASARSLKCFFFFCVVSLSSESGFCGTATLALQATGHHQTSPPHPAAPGRPRIAAVPGRERGVYAPSTTSCLLCRSYIRSGAAGTPPVPSPSWWTASVLEALMFSHAGVRSRGGLVLQNIRQFSEFPPCVIP